MVQSPSPTQLLRVTIELNQSYGRALYSKTVGGTDTMSSRPAGASTLVM